MNILPRMELVKSPRQRVCRCCREKIVSYDTSVCIRNVLLAGRDMYDLHFHIKCWNGMTRDLNNMMEETLGKKDSMG